MFAHVDADSELTRIAILKVISPFSLLRASVISTVGNIAL